jgi:hypothetical protein
MLQVFHMDVAKVDWDVAYVERLFQMFLLFFRHMLQACLFGCCICFIHMFAIILFEYCICFAMVFQVFSGFFQVFQTHVSSVSSVFRCMLQMFHMDVLKVD